MIYNNEKDFVDKVESLLKSCGCQTWREVSPEEHKDKLFPFRVDLIFFHKQIGYIAVEAKNTRSLRQGSVFGKAIEQINKYKDLHFLGGIKIDKWCITAPQEIPLITNREEADRVLSEVSHFIRHFIKYMFNISFLEFFEYDNHVWDRIAIDGFSKNTIKINKYGIENKNV